MRGFGPRPSLFATLIPLAVACSSNDTTNPMGPGGSSSSSGASTGSASGSPASGSDGGAGGTDSATTGAPGNDASAGSSGGGSGASSSGTTMDSGDDSTSSPDVEGTMDAPEEIPVGNGMLTLTSSVVMAGGTIPLKYRCTIPPTGDTSPPLTWTPGPVGTQSYAVTLLHTAAVHWVIWDIPAAMTSLPEGVMRIAMPMPTPSLQIKPNQDGSTWFGYAGPCPGGGPGTLGGTMVSQYVFTVYALNVATLPGVTSAFAGAAVITAIKAHLAAPTAMATLTVNAAK
jgi:Raf kinase inhibitor-like YbhB/YbcL family protein